jgi:phosphoenolpyruvate carboxylase
MTPPPLARDISWLHSRLDESISKAAHDDIDLLGSTARGMLETGTLDPVLSELPMDRIDAILKLLTIRFHLRNKAEQLHITRVNRDRELNATEEKPRPESIADAIGTLASRGVPLERVLETLAGLDIQPTLTAHPTESRRRSVIAKQDRIAELLVIRNSGKLTMGEQKALESDVRQTLSQLMVTDEIRSRRLDVIDEVRNGIHYLGGAIWKPRRASGDSSLSVVDRWRPRRKPIRHCGADRDRLRRDAGSRIGKTSRDARGSPSRTQPVEPPSPGGSETDSINRR